MRKMNKEAVSHKLSLLDSPTPEYAIRERIIERIYVQREVVRAPVIQELTEYEVREILRAHSRRIERLERALHSLNAPRVQVRGGDPPCVVCGTWSDDWLCPSCRDRFPWMRP